jgi:5-methylcytosine-specific restriction endonuclease McrA
VPSKYQRRLGKGYRINRAAILEGSPNCAICGGPGADTADHILPLSKGGTSALSNLRPAHLSCNARRGDRVKTRYAARW